MQGNSLNFEIFQFHFNSISIPFQYHPSSIPVPSQFHPRSISAQATPGLSKSTLIAFWALSLLNQRWEAVEIRIAVSISVWSTVLGSNTDWLEEGHRNANTWIGLEIGWKIRKRNWKLNADLNNGGAPYQTLRNVGTFSKQNRWNGSNSYSKHISLWTLNRTIDWNRIFKK